MKNLTKFFMILFIICAPTFADAAPKKKALKNRHNIEAVNSYVGLDLVSAARRFIGATASQLGLPRSLWCADFMNKITGGGTRSRVAKSYLKYGRAASYGCVGCIAVMTRKGGGHVGVVSGYDKKGNPILISGNSKNRVREHSVSRHRVIAYRYK